MTSKRKVRYTIRDLEPAVDKAVREEAAHYGVSVNRMVLRLIEKALCGGKTDPAGKKGPLKFEAWKPSEIEAMRAGVEDVRKTDPELWK